MIYWGGERDILSAAVSEHDFDTTEVGSNLLSLLAPVFALQAEKVTLAAHHLNSIESCDVCEPNTIARSVVESCIRHLESIVLPALILELHIARISGRMSGATPETRYLEFIELRRNKAELLGFLDRYPILRKLLIKYIVDSGSNVLRMLHRLANDRGDLSRMLSQELGTLLSVEAVGDHHDSGQCVLRLDFSSDIVLAYKPRPLGLDLRFSDLCSLLSNHLPSLPLRSTKVLPRQSYGWCEWHKYQPCESENEIERYYMRMGAFLFLFSQLNAVDMHFENVVAVRENPCFVDLETLFHPYFDSHGERIKRVGILPFAPRTGNIVDISVLGVVPGSRVDGGGFRIENHGTDEMRIVSVCGIISQGQHQPTAKGATALGFVKRSICEGYRVMHELAMGLKKNSTLHRALSAFDGETNRVIIRHTAYYQGILTKGFSPTALSSPNKWLNLLKECSARTAEFSEKRLLDYEIRCLRSNRIPLFRGKVGDSRVWAGSGRCVGRVQSTIGSKIVIERVLDLDNTQLMHDLEKIKNSLEAREEIQHH